MLLHAHTCVCTYVCYVLKPTTITILEKLRISSSDLCVCVCVCVCLCVCFLSRLHSAKLSLSKLLESGTHS